VEAIQKEGAMLNAPTTFIPNDLTPIYERRKDVMQQIADLQNELKVINNSLIQQFEDQAEQVLASKGKDFGQVTIKSEGFKISIDSRKRVDWDQEKLMGVLDNMDNENAKHYATVKVSVAEAKFQQAPPDIRAKLSECRTVYLQGKSVNIEVDDA
tara:strand:+ start:473 stop:937 length:465 start_codon:yes stop_codon:yes gene_type:complete